MRIVIVGGGAAGAAAAQSLSAALQKNAAQADTPGEPAAVQITVIDPRPEPVELPPLSKTLFDDLERPTALKSPPHKLDLPGVELLTAKVESIECLGTSSLQVRTTESALGSLADIDAELLIVATGLQPRTPAALAKAPADIPVLVIGNEQDAVKAREHLAALQAQHSAAADTLPAAQAEGSAGTSNTVPPAQSAGASIGVLGSGFLALELARAAADAGFRPTVYLRAGRPLPAMSPELAHAVQQLHESAGVTFEPNTPAPDPENHALWFAATGARPQLPELPAQVQLTADGRVATDELLQAAPGIFAVGDTAAPVSGPMAGAGGLGTESAATSQGMWLGRHIAEALQAEGAEVPPAAADAREAGESTGAHQDVSAEHGHAGSALMEPTGWADMPWQWSFQGPVRIFAVGAAYADCDPEPLVVGDPAAGKGQYLFFSLGGGLLVRAETINDPAGHNAARQLLAAAYAGAAHHGHPNPASPTHLGDPEHPDRLTSTHAAPSHPALTRAAISKALEDVDFRTYARQVRSTMNG